MKSDMQNRQTKKYKLKDPNTEKLVVTLDKFQNYLVHQEILVMTLRNGYKLTGTHGYFKFEHAYIFRDYIADNNAEKKQATIDGNEFKRDLSSCQASSTGRHFKMFLTRRTLKLFILIVEMKDLELM